MIRSEETTDGAGAETPQAPWMGGGGAANDRVEEEGGGGGAKTHGSRVEGRGELDGDDERQHREGDQEAGSAQPFDARRHLGRITEPLAPPITAGRRTGCPRPVLR